MAKLIRSTVGFNAAIYIKKGIGKIKQKVKNIRETDSKSRNVSITAN